MNVIVCKAVDVIACVAVDVIACVDVDVVGSSKVSAIVNLVSSMLVIHRIAIYSYQKTFR